MDEAEAIPQQYQPIRLPLILSMSPWRAAADLATIVLIVWIIPNGRASQSTAILNAGLTVGLLVFAAWRWLSAGTVQFDTTGITVSDQYWHLRGNVPIKLHDVRNARIEIEPMIWFPVVWINGVRIVVSRRMVEDIRRAANMLGAPCTNRGISLLTASPVVLTWVPLLAILFVRGTTGALLAVGIYLVAALSVLIPFLLNHQSWPRLPSR